MKKGNREHLEPEYYYRNGEKVAILVHILEGRECPCKWQGYTGYFTDGKKVYRKL